MAEQLDEIHHITSSEEPPTFENTLVPLERSGRLLDRVAEVFFNKSSADSNDITNALEERLAPQLAAHHDAIVLDRRLFDRIAAVRDGLDDAGLGPEERYLVERWHTELTLAGAGLDDAGKERLRELNQLISTLTTRVEKNLLADTNELAVIVTDPAELAGLGEGEISAAREAAAARGLQDSWLIT
ncbi:M3 family peptidase, partial [Mesorhizobium japonicum]